MFQGVEVVKVKVAVDETIRWGVRYNDFFLFEENHSEPLLQLMHVFPDHSIDTLQKALRHCEMDAEVAALLLLDNNTEALFVSNCSDNKHMVSTENSIV